MNKPTAGKRLSVLFENDNVIAIDKQPGIIVIPDQHTPKAETLVGLAELQAKSKLWVVHRIDRGTSGVLIFAKNEQAHAFISQQFEKGLVKKTYWAIVSGRVEDDSGRIEVPISVDGRKVALDGEGKPSVTDYKVVERFRDFTLVEANPGTGRRHQIRLHFMSLGYPLAVDNEYSSREALFLSEFKKKYKPAGIEKPLMARLSLHSKSAVFSDRPIGEPLTIEAPLPDDFVVTIKQLRKYNRQ